MKRRAFVIGLAAAAVGRAVEAADAYPAKPIRWLVGFAAGGASDIVVRLVAEGMQKELGVPLVLENRPGGSGNVAASALVQAPADGYTLLHGESSVLYTNEHLSKGVYSPAKAVTNIGAISSSA